MNSATHTATLADGQTIATQAGNAVVRLQAIRAGVYRVETTQGGFVVDEWTMSYPTEAEARDAARTTTIAFRAYGTAQRIADRHDELCFQRHQLDARILRARTVPQAWTDTMAALDAELATLDSLTLRATGTRLDNDMRTHLYAAAA